MIRFLLILFLFSLNFAVAASTQDTDISNPSLAAREPKYSGFDSSYMDLSQSAKISGDKKNFSISVDVSKDFTCVLSTKKGVFKPDTDYIVKFNIKNYGDTDIGERARMQSAIRSLGRSEPSIHIILRPISEAGHRRDLFRKGIHFEESPHSYFKRFKTPKDVDDFSFRILLNKKQNLEVSDFEIFEGPLDDLYPIANTAKPYDEKIDNLPTGAPEFEVELPNPMSDALVVNAADFGLNEDREDCREIIQKALDFCREKNAAKLIIPKGTYKLFTNGSLSLARMRDFTLDAQGSTFIYRRDKGCNLYLGSTQRVKVCNLTMDWDWDTFPLASIVECVGFELSPRPYESYVDLKFVDYKKHPFYGRVDTPAIVMNPWNDKIKCSGDGLRKSLYLSGLYEGAKAPKSEWLSENVLRVYVSDDVRPRVLVNNTLYRLSHNYYSQSCIVLDSSSHTTLENLNINSAAGHGILLGGIASYSQFINVNIAIPKNAPKTHCVSCSADHFHVSSSRGYIKIINCEFSNGGDDCVNIHDTSVFAVTDSENALLVNNFHPNRFKVGEEVEFRNGDFSPSNFISKVKSIEMVGESRDTLGRGLARVSFADKIPPQKGAGFVLFGKRHSTANVLIKDSKFNRKRGLLILCPNVTIDNCDLRYNLAGALKLETGYTYNIWSEGHGVDNVVVKNCKFRAGNDTCREDWGMTRDIYLGSYTGNDNDTEQQTMYPIISNVLFKNNTFTDTFGLLAFIASSGNVIFEGNTIENKRKHPSELPYRGSIFLTHAKNIKIINNTWKENSFAHPSIMIDWRTCSDIVMRGNKF